MRYFTCLVVASVLFLVAHAPQSGLAQEAASAPPIEFLTETIRQADQMGDERTRVAAQRPMVGALIRAGMPEEAFDQAMKLSKSSPHTCILSMESIGKDALKPNDWAMVERAFRAAAEVDRSSSPFVRTHALRRRRPRQTETLAGQTSPSDRAHLCTPRSMECGVTEKGIMIWHARCHKTTILSNCRRWRSCYFQQTSPTFAS